ncbi:MAG: SAM-dependent methyltransferase [Ancrocorticia sp.]
MQHNTWDVIVVGGGVAGLSAALMLGRARRRVLVIDGGEPRNRFASTMHGVLGMEGMPPGDLLARGRGEVAEYGVEFTHGTVDSAARTDDRVRLTTFDGNVLAARALIVATGVVDELPNIPGLRERWGKTVLHCPYCHGWEVRDQRLGVLALSPMALHQVELIRQWSDRVTFFSAAAEPLTTEIEQRLRSRGVVIESAPVTAVLGDGDTIDAVVLDDRRHVEIDAIFIAASLRPCDEFLASLNLARADTPMGSFLAVDMMGRTSDDRIWAVGNVTNPAANVPASIGAGSMTGGAVNAALVGWDFDAAPAPKDPAEWPKVTTTEFWEERYASRAQVWSGKVNRVLKDVGATLKPGSALDVGCGEGADVIWLAQHGWKATGIDVSATATARATGAVRNLDITPGQATFTTGALSALKGKTFDLVTVSFLHAPADLPREAILRQATAHVATGGHLLITSHVGFPPGSQVAEGHQHHFLTPAEELEQLALDPTAWEVVIAETRPRHVTSPDGEDLVIEDGVVLARRR